MCTHTRVCVCVCAPKILIHVWVNPHGMMAKVLDCGLQSKLLRTPVALLHSLSNKYWETPVSPCCSSTRIALTINNP